MKSIIVSLIAMIIYVEFLLGVQPKLTPIVIPKDLENRYPIDDDLIEI